MSDMFRLPQGSEGGPNEGTEKTHPLILNGYKKKDFIALLKVMYPRCVGRWRNWRDQSLTWQLR